MDPVQAFFSRHERIALLASAGKDSAALIKLLRNHLSRVTVVWVNPGNPYPETVDYMRRLSATLPHFVEVKGDQPAFIAKHGYPLDFMPFEGTPLGRKVTGTAGPKVVPLEKCCRANLWEPAWAAVKELRATGCLRGDKLCDALQADTPNGATVDGVEVFYPLAAWSDKQVFDFLGDDVPASYARGLRSSLDCMNCTAYLGENPGRMADLRAHHPRVWAEVQPVIEWARDSAFQHLEALEAQQ